MAASTYHSKDRRIWVITLWSLIVNIALCLIKIGVGFLAGSMALVADGVHSLSDMATDVAVLLGHWLGAKAPDQKHPYGHGRWETFSAAFIAAVLIIVGAGTIYVAALDLTRGRHATPHLAVMGVAVLSVVAKEVLYRLTVRVAQQSRSTALYANAWHHRSDALSSVAVLIGYGALLMGFGHGDQLAATAVGLMVLLVGLRVLGDCFNELTESAVDQGTIALITEVINGDSAIHEWHKLRTRSVGREIFLDLHILVDPKLDITQAHGIAENLERAIQERLTCPVNITIHIEPDLPEQRV
jgi:cation diffusion facilitator family transporter